MEIRRWIGENKGVIVFTLLVMLLGTLVYLAVGIPENMG